MKRLLEFIADDGVVLRAEVHGPDSSATRLIMSHGNGLATAGYTTYWSRLANDFQIVLLDFRGHGWSDCGDLSHHSWEQFERDLDMVLVCVEQALGARTTFGVFHSLSAIVALRHVRQCEVNWSGLLLFDPPLMPPDGHPLQQWHLNEMEDLSARVIRRREVFSSPIELASQFRKSRVFARWQPEALDDMAQALLRRIPRTETWRLSCPPEFESRIFASNADKSLWSWLPHCGIPLKLVCADPSVPGVQSSARIGRAVSTEFGLDYDYVEGATHFLQMERPGTCAGITHEFCKPH
ncbi:MAG: alpha/beta hydrolase [Burkholderiaceae bacterium]|nr:MAG: alpha/beta hydrolase [Burkholderiaceae bacterium]